VGGRKDDEENRDKKTKIRQKNEGNGIERQVREGGALERSLVLPGRTNSPAQLMTQPQAKDSYPIESRLSGFLKRWVGVFAV